MNGRAAVERPASSSFFGEDDEECRENTDIDSKVDQQEVESAKKRRRLFELLLESLLFMARPICGKIGAIQAHTLVQNGPQQQGMQMRQSRSADSESAEAFYAQVLLEMLLSGSSSNGPASSRSMTVPPSTKQFTRSIIFVKAQLNRNAGGAALLLEAVGKWEAGVDVRVKELIEVALSLGQEHENEKEVFEQAVLRLFHSHVLCRDGDGNGIDWKVRHSMARKILKCWASLGFCSGPLEALCAREAHERSLEWHMMNAIFTDLLILYAGMLLCSSMEPDYF